jgi:3D (Asp-Asp-Asp) domain-containing protein
MSMISERYLKRMIIVIEVMIIIFLLITHTSKAIPTTTTKITQTIIIEKPVIKKADEIIIKEIVKEYYYMNITAYTIHPKCTPNLKGITASNTKVHKGVAAINVDWVKDKWVIRSPLKLGQRIYIEGMGEFSIEDTGCFSGNHSQDMYTVDIFVESYEEAIKFGRQLRKVFIISS